MPAAPAVLPVHHPVRRRRAGAVALLLAGLLAAAATPSQAQPAKRVLNINNWADYIGPDVIQNFQKETGIQVRYDATVESNETLHARLVAGKTGYDIVVPGAHFAAKQIKGGLLQPLNRDLLPNWKNLDPAILEKLAQSDPGNRHLVNWMWGFVTVGINEQKVREVLSSTPLPANPLDLVFKPEYASKLKNCGIHVLDSASEVVPVAMLYAGKDGFSATAKDYDAARQVLAAARPNVTRIFSPGPINDLASGALCVSLGYSGDFNIANQRAREAGKTFTIKPLIPPRGATMFLDSMAIPKDAKNVAEAHAFINYILRPEVHATLTNAVFYGNPNAASKAHVKPELAANPTIFPPAADIAKLAVMRDLPNDVRRVQTRVFTDFKANRQ
ncbi:extracellular solute-binding protein [Pseudaquabacterium pictum]|uniref:Putrescine-binding periplasmic protein n=1 Tax=Pseudaquabacterium pictum TaxID=2315236 RepID=A0A480AJ73_9BURK|nr:extracellular solute-binding protein [Rubrivivax pictus]GCL61066.1 putrescine-binding periplasmic protein [Rubrivivax pictus]